MTQPASQEDLQRLIRSIEAIDRKLTQTLSDITSHLRHIHNDITAALEAIGDEQVESESRYASSMNHDLETLRDEMKASYQYIKHCLDEIDVDHQKIKRYLEEQDTARRKRS